MQRAALPRRGDDIATPARAMPNKARSKVEPKSKRAAGARSGEPAAVALPTEALHRALLEGMLDPVVFIDGMGTILGASRSTERVFGYAPDELVGRNVKLLMPEPYHSEHDGHLARYRRTGKTGIIGQIRDFQVVRKDGEVIDVELSVNRVDLPGDRAPVFIGSFRDSTELKQARRTESSMQRALAAVGEQAAVLVHEIKNPVTAINLALRAVASELGESQQAVLDDLVSRMRRLEQQLRQTLGFVRALELRPVRCDAPSVLAAVRRSVEPIARRAGAAIEIDVDARAPAFQADADRLEEVLVNLAVNAVEALSSGGHGASASRPGGRVRLRAAGAGDKIVIAVEDDGPGIAPSVRATLFKPFVTTKGDGTGLGLAICRRVIDEHGGTIEAGESEQLGGACFRITLPAEDDA